MCATRKFGIRNVGAKHIRSRALNTFRNPYKRDHPFASGPHPSHAYANHLYM